MSLLSTLARTSITSTQSISHGSVLAVRGPIVIAKLPQASIGDICQIRTSVGLEIQCQVVTFEKDLISLAPFDELCGISPGNVVINKSERAQILIPNDCRGLVMDSLGRSISSDQFKADTISSKDLSLTKLKLYSPAPAPLSRSPMKQIMPTGVRSIDTLCTIAYGQRIGLLAGPGLGKSTLLGMIARNAEVDVVVVALVGERGREVQEFVHQTLGDIGMARTVLVVETSEKPAMKRALAAVTATAIAEHYRAKGMKVLLLVDSLTRMARAIRDVSLSAGELPIRQGLTPSVYSELPKLIERAGCDSNGSITAIYTLLDTSEYELDPLAEEVKSLLDGHISLDSAVAQSGIRPAIDFTRSISRLNFQLHDAHFLERQKLILKMYSRIKKDKDILLLGGAPDDELKAFLTLENELREFLNQNHENKFDISQSLQSLHSLSELIRRSISAISH